MDWDVTGLNRLSQAVQDKALHAKQLNESSLNRGGVDDAVYIWSAVTFSMLLSMRPSVVEAQQRYQMCNMIEEF